MDTTERVIEGLKCHLSDPEGRVACGKCPYNDEYSFCLNRLHIDARKLIEEQKKQIESMNFIYGFIYGGQVKEFRELVRCKDCKFWYKDECSHLCKITGDLHPANWFCADGERK